MKQGGKVNMCDLVDKVQQKVIFRWNDCVQNTQLMIHLLQIYISVHNLWGKRETLKYYNIKIEPMTVVIIIRCEHGLQTDRRRRGGVN